MPPRSNPRPTGQPRRKPGPYLPGSLILILIAVALGGAFFFANPGSSGTIEYNEFIKLSELKNLKKVTFVGKDRAAGEVKNTEDEFTKSLKLPGGRFSVALPPANDRSQLGDRLLRDNPEVAISSEDEHGAWVGVVL